MFRIDTSRAAQDRPASAAPGTPGYFSNGDPAAGYLPTQLDGEWCNGLQENLMAVLADGGIAAVKGPAGDTNLRDAIRAMIAGRTRLVLSTNLNLYVAPGGNDTNPGTLAAPFASVQGAVNHIYHRLDLNGAYGVNINVAAGTYSGVVVIMGRPVGAPGWWSTPIAIIGDPANPANVHLTLADPGNSLINVGAGASVQLTGLKLSHSGPRPGRASLVHALNGGWVYVDSIECGAAPSAQLYAHQGRIETNAIDPGRASAKGYTVSGPATFHFAAAEGGYILTTGSTITLTGTPAFQTVFAFAETGGRLLLANTAFVGGATGNRYGANPGGVIDTAGGGANYLPGSLPGNIHALGYYA